MQFRHLISALIALAAAVCSAENTVDPELNKADGEVAGHEYVDLGLPSKTLWATCNLGASTPYEYGDYYAWGEAEPKLTFSWENYRYVRGIDHEGSFYWHILDDIGEEISGTEYDAAALEWGHGWRLPTYQECYELHMLGWQKWTTDEQTNGTRAYGTNEKSIFLPAGGIGGEGLNGEEILSGVCGYYWTGTYSPWCTNNGTPIEPSIRAKSLWVDLSHMQVGDIYKCGGANIRPVISKSDAGIKETSADSPYISLKYANRQLKSYGDIEGCTVTVTDLAGRIVLRTPAQDVMTLSDLNEGIYVVSMDRSGVLISTIKIDIR